MAFSIDAAWEQLDNILKSKQSAAQSWAGFIDFLEQQSPKEYWAQLKRLDLEEEQQQLTECFEEIFTESPLPESVLALWFGIVKFWDEENQVEVYVLYLSGSDTYNTEDVEWATEPVYLPDNRYLISDIMNEVDVIIQEDEADYSFLDWILPLAYAAFTLNEILNHKLQPELLLKSQSMLFAATGHDSGDFVNLSTIHKANVLAGN